VLVLVPRPCGKPRPDRGPAEVAAYLRKVAPPGPPSPGPIPQRCRGPPTWSGRSPPRSSSPPRARLADVERPRTWRRPSPWGSTRWSTARPAGAAEEAFRDAVGAGVPARQIPLAVAPCCWRTDSPGHPRRPGGCPGRLSFLHSFFRPPRAGGPAGRATSRRSPTLIRVPARVRQEIGDEVLDRLANLGRDRAARPGGGASGGGGTVEGGRTGKPVLDPLRGIVASARRAAACGDGPEGVVTMAVLPIRTFGGPGCCGAGAAEVGRARRGATQADARPAGHGDRGPGRRAGGRPQIGVPRRVFVWTYEGSEGAAGQTRPSSSSTARVEADEALPVAARPQLPGGTGGMGEGPSA